MAYHSSYTRSGLGRRAEENTPETALRGFLEHSIERAEVLNPRFAHLWREISRLALGGKGLRPQLVTGTVRAYPSRPTLPVINAVAAAFELLHTGLIIHDDVIDQDRLRRHHPTLNAAAADHALGRFREAGQDTPAAHAQADQYGRSAGIIAGDLAITGAYRLIATSYVPEKRLLRLLSILDKAVFRSAAGELMDIEHSLPGAPVPNQEVLETSRLKTAAYSFEAPLKAGAVLGGAPAADVKLLGQVGRVMGTAYQLVDDLLGVFGDPAQTGKSAVSDLREGKHTMLISIAENSSEGLEVREFMERAVSHGLDDQDVTRVRELLVHCGAKSGVERMVQEAKIQAQELIQESNFPPQLRQELLETLVKVTQRSM